MTDNEFILFDRITKIKSVIRQYGEDNFVVKFSGGKDSTVVSWLVDEALPGNQIPRVYADTGIELKMIRDFVKKKASTDDRFKIIKPSKPIIPTLKEIGYPFKSKKHSEALEHYQKNHDKTDKWISHYLEGYYTRSEFNCPEILKSQFEPDYPLKVSDKCCKEMKEKPLERYCKENGKPYSILGLMRAEGGRRLDAQCLAFKGKKLWHFQPLVAVTKEWEEWLIKEKGIDICDIYRPPYNFNRTGCKGCPFNPQLQRELDTMERLLPKERKQCEIIWKPVYEEYRRLGYRLNKGEQGVQEEFRDEDFEEGENKA